MIHETKIEDYLMSPIPTPFLLKKWGNHACIYMKI